MAKAFAAQAGGRLSQALDGLTEYAEPLFKGSRSDLLKRFGPIGLIAAAIGGGGYALKRHFGRARPAPMVDAETAPKAKKGKKNKSKK